MIKKEFIIRYIKEREVLRFATEKTMDKSNKMNFILNYSNTYILHAVSEKKIKYLNDDVFNILKKHKHGLYFSLEYDIKTNNISLIYMIYGSPISKSIRVIHDIKTLLLSFGINTTIKSVAENKSGHVTIEFI